MNWLRSYESDLGFDIVMFTLFSISIKFSTQYNKILGYKYNSAWMVVRILWKSILIESMLKFCSVFEYHDLNAIEKSKVAEKISTSFPTAEISS